MTTDITVTTDTYWDIDGVPLNSYAWNIQTLGGDRESPGVFRGSDLVVPYVPGTRWVPKQPDARVLTLGMWVQGSNPDGSYPTDSNLQRVWKQNWNKLKNLIWRPDEQFVLTKRFWVLESDLTAAGVDVSSLPADSGYRLYSASALASFAGGLSPTMQGPGHSEFTVDFLLSDPFFYGSAITIPFTTAPADATNAGPTQTPLILGDYRTTAIQINFVGPLNTPVITNQAESQGLYVQYSNSIAQGESATLNVSTFSATHYLTGGSYKAAGYVAHAGDKFWLYMRPGTPTLALTAQSGTGTASLTYQPRWH